MDAHAASPAASGAGTLGAAAGVDAGARLGNSASVTAMGRPMIFLRTLKHPIVWLRHPCFRARRKRLLSG
jgi:hypothetical protein